MNPEGLMDVKTLEEAQAEILQTARPVDETEERRTDEAVGFISAATVRAEISQPPFSRSPLDGYALRSEDSRGASRENPRELQVIEKVTAGTAPQQGVVSGTAVRLMTGAPIPRGADCVIRQEDTDYGESRVRIFSELHPHDNICDEGEDFCRGDVLVESGARLDSVTLAVLAAAGRSKVRVYRRPRAALFSSGDEILQPGEPLTSGKIYDANLCLLRCRMKEWNVDIVESAPLPDDPWIAAEKIRAAAEKADLIITSGGVSVGQKDIMHDVVKLLNARRLFGKIAVKPGGPSFAYVFDNVPVLALTGNPFGVLVHLEMLAAPLVAAVSRDRSVLPVEDCGTALTGFPKRSSVRRLIRAKADHGAVTIPRTGQRSGILSSMLGCNCLVDIPAGTAEVCSGSKVKIWHLSS
jgi:molybdopterin molybdotransferase